MIVSLTLTFPSSSLISYYDITFYTSLLSTVPLSTCLSVSDICFAILPSVLTTVLTEHQVWLVCHYILFLSLMLPWCKWYFFFDLADQWLSICQQSCLCPRTHAQWHILPHLPSNPSSKPISLWDRHHKIRITKIHNAIGLAEGTTAMHFFLVLLKKIR